MVVTGKSFRLEEKLSFVLLSVVVFVAVLEVSVVVLAFSAFSALVYRPSWEFSVVPQSLISVGLD
jgi:hypothetical protein